MYAPTFTDDELPAPADGDAGPGHPPLSHVVGDDVVKLPVVRAVVLEHLVMSGQGGGPCRRWGSN